MESNLNEKQVKVINEITNGIDNKNYLKVGELLRNIIENEEEAVKRLKARTSSQENRTLHPIIDEIFGYIIINDKGGQS